MIQKFILTWRRHVNDNRKMYACYAPDDTILQNLIIVVKILGWKLWFSDLHRSSIFSPCFFFHKKKTESNFFENTIKWIRPKNTDMNEQNKLKKKRSRSLMICKEDMHAGDRESHDLSQFALHVGEILASHCIRIAKCKHFLFFQKVVRRMYWKKFHLNDSHHMNYSDCKKFNTRLGLMKIR